MSKAEKTKEFIIERSSQVFNKKGFAGTSMADLVDVTGLTKGAIYGNFENKDEVALAVFDYNIQNLNKRVSAFLSGRESATDRLIGWAEFYKTNWKSVFEKGGCAILNTSVEADDSVTFLKNKVQKSIGSWAGLLSKTIEDGKKNGEFKKEIDSTEYAYTFIALIEGGIMLGKIMNNQKHLYTALDRMIIVIRTELKN